MPPNPEHYEFCWSSRLATSRRSEGICHARIPGDPNVGSGLSLWFFNTDRFSLTGHKSIYDSDGAVLAISRPGSGGSGLRAACAVLAPPLGAPSVGTGLVGERQPPAAARTIVVGIVAVAGGAAAAWALRRRTG